MLKSFIGFSKTMAPEGMYELRRHAIDHFHEHPH